jgi:hypothetical protein
MKRPAILLMILVIQENSELEVVLSQFYSSFIALSPQESSTFLFEEMSCILIFFTFTKTLLMISN